jgi:hypothetical protein
MAMEVSSVAKNKELELLFRSSLSYFSSVMTEITLVAKRIKDVMKLCFLNARAHWALGQFASFNHSV